MLGQVEALEEETGLVTNRVRDDLSFGKLVHDGGADQGCIHFQQLHGQPGERLDRQSAMALVRGGLKREGDPGADTLWRGLFHPELGCDGVCRLEADPAYILGQTVWVLGHNLNGFIAVGFEDAYRPRGANAVSMEEDHDLPHRLLLGPAGDNAGRPHRTDSRHFRQALRLGLDDFKGVHAKGSDDPFGHSRSNAAHLTRSKVLFDALCSGRRGGLEDLSLELKAMCAVAVPQAAGGDPFACRDGRGVTHDRHKISFAPRMDLQDGEAILGIVESHELHRAREGL